MVLYILYRGKFLCIHMCINLHVYAEKIYVVSFSLVNLRTQNVVLCLLYNIDSYKCTFLSEQSSFSKDLY